MVSMTVFLFKRWWMDFLFSLEGFIAASVVLCTLLGA